MTSKTFSFECKGRRVSGKPALFQTVPVELSISQRGDFFDFSVKCPHNTGGHGQRCKASHPDVDKVGEGIICPYSVDLPYAVENS